MLEEGESLANQMEFGSKKGKIEKKGQCEILKVCLHVPSPPNFIIVPMEMNRLMDRIGMDHIVFVNVNFTVMETVCVNVT